MHKVLIDFVFIERDSFVQNHWVLGKLELDFT
jgi:hypothetical protein